MNHNHLFPVNHLVVSVAGVLAGALNRRLAEVLHEKENSFSDMWARYPKVEEIVLSSHQSPPEYLQHSVAFSHEIVLHPKNSAAEAMALEVPQDLVKGRLATGVPIQAEIQEFPPLSSVPSQ